MMNRNRYTAYGLFALTIFILLGCFSVRPSGQKGNNNLYETFFLGEGMTQKFIKPLRFNANTKDIIEHVDIDFTYRTYSNEVVSKEDTAIVKFSVLSTTKIVEIESMRLQYENTSTALKDITLIYTEKSKKEHKARFSAVCSQEKMLNFFLNTSNVIKVNILSQEFELSPTSATQRKIRKLNDTLLYL